MSVSKTLNIVQLFVIIVMGYFLWLKPEPAPFDTSFIEEQKKQLHMENVILLDGIKVKEEKIRAFEHKFDSLEKVKPENKKHYDKVYKKIGRYSSSQLIHELDSAFASDTR